MYHTPAFILKKYEWNEADWLITALSEDFGKIRLLVQGARKHGAKLQGHLEPLSFSALTFVRGRTFYRLVGAELKNFFQAIRDDFFKLQAGNIMIETLEKNLFEERSSASSFFNLLKNNFDFLEDAIPAGQPRINEILASFHFDFLRLEGLAKITDQKTDPALLYQRVSQTVFKPRAVFLPEFRYTQSNGQA